ncbi:type VI secretion system baseplate subunit TssF, partial [Staphylococcus aureus]
AFQEKFLFVDIDKLGPLPAAGEADLLIGLSRPPAGRFDLDADSVLPNCVPIINLFVKTAEPIRLTHTQSEYLVRPELNAEAQYEIHSIT